MGKIVIDNKKTLMRVLKSDKRFITFKEFIYRVNLIENKQNILYVDIVKLGKNKDLEAILTFQRINKVKNKVYYFTSTIN